MSRTPHLGVPFITQTFSSSLLSILPAAAHSGRVPEAVHTGELSTGLPFERAESIFYGSCLSLPQKEMGQIMKLKH